MTERAGRARLRAICAERGLSALVFKMCLILASFHGHAYAEKAAKEWPKPPEQLELFE